MQEGGTDMLVMGGEHRREVGDKTCFSIFRSLSLSLSLSQEGKGEGRENE